jgi:homocysteine S-methyltransferase
MTVTILDGGMGQELVARSTAAPTPLWATKVMMDQPELVESIHADFFAAGAQVATVNSYAIHHDRLVQAGLDDHFDTLHLRACEIAKTARDAHGSGRVAGSLGPLGWSYRPDMAPAAPIAAGLYAEIVALQEPHVDLFLCETMAGVDQARGALMGLSNTKLPVWLSLSTSEEDGTKLRSGEDLSEILPLVDRFQPEAVLINCTSPEVITDALGVFSPHGVALGAYANGFVRIVDSFKSNTATVADLNAREDLSPVVYADFAEQWVEAGASIIGGCCEIGPAHIAELSRRFSGA